MKIKSKIGFASLSFISLCLSIFAVQSTNNQIDVFAKAYTNGDAATYYNSIGQYATGSDLTTALNTLNNSRRLRLISYNSLSQYFTQTDPGAYSGQVTAFYSGTSARYNGNMNREHVWPYSKLYLNGADRADEGKNEVEQDLQMIRPALKDDNTGRGNSFFTMPDGQGWDPGSLGNETYRGDSARIIFYCTIADLNLTLVDRDYDSKDNHTMGRLSTLLQWNLQYPVLQREKTRNEAVESLQGHRNPFIDHPEYACRIWGNYNSETQRICSAQGLAGELSIKNNNTAISKYDLEVDDSVTLSAFVNNSSSGTYTWSFSNMYGVQSLTDIASMNSSDNHVTITGLKVGSTYLKVATTVTLPNGTVENLWKVIELNVTPKISLTSININSFPYKTDYNVGETFNPSGINITARFSDGSERNITSEVTYGDTTLDRAGAKQISVFYTFKGVTMSTSFSVIVREEYKPSNNSSSGCGGNIVVTSALLSSLALMGLFILGVSLKKRRK